MNEPHWIVWIVVTIFAAIVSGISIPFLEKLLAQDNLPITSSTPTSSPRPGTIQTDEEAPDTEISPPPMEPPPEVNTDSELNLPEEETEVQEYPDGSRYEGQIQNGIRDGLGTYVAINGDRYTGEWHNDMRHGVGSYIWSNGDIYRGEWRNNLRHGRGVFTGYDGLEKQGIWEDDRLINEVP